jgi:hypothetical protein
MYRYLILVVGFFLVGCDNANKLNELETRTKNLESNATDKSNWVLWVTVEWVDSSKFSNFGWPKVLSSFNTKKECLEAPQKYVWDKKIVLGNDPYIVSDGTYKYIYSCLPPNLNLRQK